LPDDYRVAVCPATAAGTNRSVVAIVPSTTSLVRLAEAAAHCRACELYANATQTVFGAGPKSARVMMVGEQPGDVEDRRGEPFVGPAGKLLDRAMVDAGLNRDDVYLTNAVKHFRWKSTGGKRRIHQKPDASHITACRPWLAAELTAVRPDVVVVLGAVAAAAVFGPAFRLTQHRGQRLDWPADGPLGDAGESVEYVVTTLHPSAVLRGGDNRAAMYDAFVADLCLAVG
jgi:DNA polymerase